MNHLELALRFRLATPLHTTGNRWTWSADKALALSAETQQPVIPATTWKGALRSHVEAVLRSSGASVCESPQPATMCADPAALCLVCRVFGNPRYPAPLRCADAHPVDLGPSAVRSGVSLSRYRRAAQPGRLFLVEVAGGAGETWAGKAGGDFATPAAAQEAAALVALGARATYALGGGQSRGLGWLAEVTLTTTLDGQPLSAEVLHQLWRSWLGGQA